MVSWVFRYSYFLRNHQIVFQCGCSSFVVHGERRSCVPVFSHPNQHIMSSEFFIEATPILVSKNLRVLLIHFPDDKIC